MSENHDEDEKAKNLPSSQKTSKLVADQAVEEQVKKVIEQAIKQGMGGPSPKKKVINKISKEISVQLAVSQQFSGPLPHPEILAQFEKVLSGSADRIITAFENETEHRQHIENSIVNAQTRAVDAEIKERSCGQTWAGVLVILLILSATVCALYGAEEYAKIIGGTTIVGLATLFIFQSRAKKDKS